nr:InlB B-repeat-containing protein [Candidatus Enterousia merdequi]
MTLLSFTLMMSVWAEVITSDISGGCTDGLFFYPVFEINSYTCESGTFLPAGATKCVLCPVEHICGGGTYVFNETEAQGIIFNYPFTQDITNSCDNTFRDAFFPIFEPNEINIDWVYDNGNIGHTTCTYDSGIILPPEPTRPGYTFKGWKLEKQD